MRQGLLRKMLLVMVLLLSFVIHYAFNVEIVSKFVAIYIILMEIISIFENLEKAGIKFEKINKFIKKEN